MASERLKKTKAKVIIYLVSAVDTTFRMMRMEHIT